MAITYPFTAEYTTGATLTVQIYDSDGDQVGDAVAMTESPAGSGYYSAFAELTQGFAGIGYVYESGSPIMHAAIVVEGAALADIYDAEHDFSRGDSTDEHRVTWWKNGGLTGVAPTSPECRLLDENGDEVFTWTAMTVLETNDFIYVATGAERITVGKSYRFERRATIDGEVRTHGGLVSRDIGPAATFGQDDYDAIAAGVRVQIASSMDSVVSGSDITIHRGDTITISLADLGNVSSRTKLWFTIKGSLDDEDSESIILATEADGLVTIIGRDPVSGETCTVTVTDETTGAVTIVLSAGAAKVLTLGSGKYDIQIKTSTGVTTLTEGEFIVAADVTKAIA